MRFHKEEKKKNGEVKFRCSSQPINPDSDVSAAGDVYSHLETTTKRSSPNVNSTPTTTTTTTALTKTGPYVWERSRTFIGSVSQHSFDKAVSAEMRINCLLFNRAKSTSSERTNFDANQGKLIRITAVSINCSK